MSRDSWWLDYVEGELDVSTHVQMKLLLKASERDQKLVHEMAEAKRLLKENASGSSIENAFNEAEILEDDFFDRLESKIMAQVEKTEIKPAPLVQITAKHRRLATKGVGAGVAAIALVLATQGLMALHLNPQWEVAQVMSGQFRASPQTVASLTYQNETDFLVDVGAASLDHLSHDQIRQLMGKKN